MKFALGTKEEMTTIYDEVGRAHAVTAVSIGPLSVLGKRSQEKDGYEAVELGFGSASVKNMSKAMKGKLEKASGGKVESGLRGVRENKISGEELEKMEVGTKVDPFESFAEGDKVSICGITKGKGFQGVVKRHGFAGGPRTHGQKHSERSPGSIGATGPQRVLKGVRMAGRMGGDRNTIKNLKIIKMDRERGVAYISGALPGRKGTLIEIRGIK